MINDELKKRCFDLVLAIPALILCAPIMAIIGLGIRLTMGKGMLFRQMRPGLQGKPFILLKFRTMIETHDAHGNLLDDAERLTLLGRFLRKSSLDELPELFNVLKGEMSLVGPRPLRMEYLDRYTPQQMRRHEVKPGITGWAQVNGRNAISWEEKFGYDVWYVDNWSIGLNVKIIGLTILNILKREGINQPGQATMEEFMGAKHLKS